MKSCKKEFNYTLEIKKSKFIAYICPYNRFDILLKELKNEHTKARHFVYAYRYINDFNQIVENSSDDGEPKGTSAKPSLAVLQGQDIINTAVIIVRYFGGIKLGTGGLVRAYSDAVNEVCKIAQFQLYEKLLQQSIQIKYKDLSKLEYQLSKLNIKIVKKEFLSNVTLILEGSKEKFSSLDEIRDNYLD